MNILSESRRRLEYAKNLMEDLDVIKTLEKYGDPLLVGSIAMETVWNRDVDIVVETGDMRGASLDALEEFVVGKKFSKYQYGDFIDFPRKNRPSGYIVNLLHRDEGGELWEIEIWFLKDISYYKGQLEEWNRSGKNRNEIILEKAKKCKNQLD